MIHEIDQAWKVPHRKYAINFLDHTCEWVNKYMSIYHSLFTGLWAYLQTISETLLLMGFPSPIKISWCSEFFGKFASDRVAPGLRHSSHLVWNSMLHECLPHSSLFSVSSGRILVSSLFLSIFRSTDCASPRCSHTLYVFECKLFLHSVLLSLLFLSICCKY